MKLPVRRSEGMTLIEIVISMALLGIVGIGLVSALSAGMLTSTDVEDKAMAQDVTTSQLEDTLSQEYLEPPIYPSVSHPDGYVLTSNNAVQDVFLLQRIQASLANPGKTILEAMTHKVNLDYYPPPPGQSLAQMDYRWYQNTEDLTPSAALGDENQLYNIVQHGLAYRLRFNLLAGEEFPSGSLSLKLQFATSTAGPWIDLGPPGSAETWRGYDNPATAEGALLPSVLLSSSTVAQTYEEGNPSLSNPIEIASGASSEWDWVLQDNGAADNTTYYFRMVKSDGTPLFGYYRHATLVTPPPTSYTQFDYRWHSNEDTLTPAVPLAAEHTPYISISRSQAYRLRLNLAIDGSEMPSGSQSFRLEFATSTSGPWTEVGTSGSGTIWRGYDNPTPPDGTTLSALLLSTSTTLGSYEEENPSVLNPNSAALGERVEWDWVIEDNGATENQAYYFRMANASGDVLDVYGNYPMITISPPAVASLAQQEYRWYANVDGITPSTPLAEENAPLAATTSGTVYRLRMNLSVSYYDLPALAQSFKLQYSTSTAGPWTDVAPAESESIWRGFGNPTPPDGTMLSALRLLDSDVLASYEEENPSSANPNVIAVNQRGEWDWVVFYDGPTDGTLYYFRMARSDGSGLDGYTRYPNMTVPLVVSLTQQDYRWYQNTNGLTPTSPLADQNSEYSLATPATVYRLRISAQAANTSLPAGSESFKLQYATGIAGPWTDLGAPGSTEIWHGYDNSSPTDGVPIPSLLLSTSDVSETYEESNPSATISTTIANGQLGEWDWVIQNGGASGSTTYYFRMVRSSGNVLDSYSSYPQIATVSLTYSGDYYRWYQNRNNATPNDPIANENTSFSGATLGTVYRLRANVVVGANDLAPGGQAFKLQFSTSTVGPWTDAGGLTSSEVWKGYNNSPGDGATISTVLLSNTNVGGTYEEANPSAYNPNAVLAGQRTEYDWVLQNNGAAGSTTYYFRMVRSDGTALDAYNRYPELVTAALTFTQDYFRWYQNSDGIGAGTALAGENTAYVSGAMGQVYRLRTNILVGTSNLPASTQAFKLQYSASTGGPWTDLGAASSSDIWRGYDNPTPADGAALASIVLSNSVVPQSYEEENPSAVNPNSVTAGQIAEYDWVIQENGAQFDTPYYFRVVRTDGSSLNTYNRYPQITTPPTTTYHQRDYRWYQNTDSLTPTTALNAENSSYDASTPNLTYRLRLNVEITGLDLAANSSTLNLQYSTSTVGPWVNVGTQGSPAVWMGYENPTPTDGTTLSALLLSTSTILESYEEENPSSLNPNGISIGEKGEWDWALQENDANPSTNYYFRAVLGDGTLLATYTNYPQITTAAAPTFTQDDYRWYENVDSIDPVTPLAAQNDTYTAVSSGQAYRLRLNVLLGGNALSAGARSFKLQYSTSTAGTWTDVGVPGSGTAWRGLDNPAPTDGAAIASLKLTTSTVSQSYVEANPTPAIPNPLSIGDRAEWDFVLEENSALSGTTYYFRVVRSDGTVFTSYLRYPQITTAVTWSVVAWDDFESGGYAGGGGWFDSWTHVGTPTVMTENSPYQGTYHARLRRANDRIRRQTDLFGRTSARLRVWVKATSWEPGETAVLMVNSDGSTWVTAYTWTDAISDDTYYYYDIDLASFPLTSTFWISFEAEMGDVNDFLYIDDIQMVAY